MLPIGHPLLTRPFALFFASAVVWALAAMLLWLGVLNGLPALPSLLPASRWHAHEMIFGFVLAAIAGFLLTALPNWTARPALNGAPLLALWLCWVLARVGIGASAMLGRPLGAVLALLFPLALAGIVQREIFLARNWRNVGVAAALTLLAVSELLIVAAPLYGALGQRLALAAVLCLLSLIGGRITPLFTRNWLRARGEHSLPPTPDRLDTAGQVLLVAAVLGWALQPGAWPSAALLMLAGTATLLRLGRWRAHRTLAEPLVWALHAGWAWLGAGLLLLGIASIWPHQLAPGAALHALTVGAIGTMVIAVMSRASLGHSGQPLSADGWITASYLAMSGAAAARVAASLLPLHYRLLLSLSVACWCAAGALLLWRYRDLPRARRAPVR